MKDHSETIYCSNTSYFTKKLILQKYRAQVVVVHVRMEVTERTVSGMDLIKASWTSLVRLAQMSDEVFPLRWVQQKFFPNEA